MRNKIIDVLQTWDDRKRNIHRESQRAKVVAITPTTAIIRVGGSQQTQEALIPSGSDVSVNDEVFVQPQNTNSKIRWIITAVISRNNAPSGSMATQRQYVEIFPPSNFEIDNSVPGAVTVKWDAPITYPVVFQVQTDLDYSIDPEQVSVQTRGSYAIISTSVEIDVRVRSVAPDGQKSGWSAWLTVAPAAGTAFDPYTSGYWSSYGFPFRLSDGSLVSQGN